jgi:hypothetical protein
MFNKRNRDKFLGVAAAITFLIGLANALEYFFANKNYLDIYTGAVANVKYKTFDGRRNILYAKTSIELAGIKKNFHLSDRAEDGGYIEVSTGDTITIFARKSYQFLYNYDFRDNIYYAEKKGEMLYNNLDRWKTTAFSNMCIYGGCALFLFIMFLDQVKNISISNWYQKRFLNKPKD